MIVCFYSDVLRLESTSGFIRWVRVRFTLLMDGSFWVSNGHVDVVAIK